MTVNETLGQVAADARDLAPNLFLIGGQKCGSTTLADHLVQSADIAYFYGTKEPNIFSLEDRERIKTRLCNVSSEQLEVLEKTAFWLDASVDYTRFPYIREVPRHIAEFSKAPRFIYIIRDPLKRAISHYYWNRQRYGETLDFETALATDPRYANTSKFDLQIAQYLEFFDIEAFKFLTFETYVADAEENLRALLNWIGAQAPDQSSKEKQLKSTDKNVTREARFPAFNRLLRNNKMAKGLAKALVPERLHVRANRMLSKSVPRQPIPLEVQQRVFDRHFSDSIERTRELTGLSLSDWVRPT